MKRMLLYLFLLMSLTSKSQVKMPALSPLQSFRQEFGLGYIEIKYSRPSMRGRKIFGDLVPFGKIWRTGANAATSIYFSDPVTINGKNIDTGTYALYLIPQEKKWTFILNKGVSNWGTSGYKESDDVMRFDANVEEIKMPKETFTMQLANMKTETCELHIMWEKSSIVVPISTDIKMKLKARLEAALQTDKKPFYQAAQYYNEYEKDYSKALGYSQQAVAANPDAYWIWLYQAKIQKQLGDIKGAKESSAKSMEAAKKDDNDDYIKLNEEFQKSL